MGTFNDLALGNVYLIGRLKGFVLFTCGNHCRPAGGFFSTLMATFSAFKHENVSKSGLAKNLDIVLLFSQQHLATIKTCLDSGEAGQSKTAPRV